MDRLTAAGAAAASDEFGCYIPDDEPGLALLKQKGYVRLLGNPWPSDWYTCTEKFQHELTICLRLTSPSPLSQFTREDVELEDCTRLELILRLSNEGWTDTQVRTLVQEKKQAPFTGNNKVWHSHWKGKIHKEYLMTLLHAHEMLEKGQVASIHHGQPKAYYTALRHGVVSPLPNQPYAYYKALMKRGSGRKNEQEQMQHLFEFEMEPEESSQPERFLVFLDSAFLLIPDSRLDSDSVTQTQTQHFI